MEDPSRITRLSRYFAMIFFLYCCLRMLPLLHIDITLSYAVIHSKSLEFRKESLSEWLIRFILIRTHIKPTTNLSKNWKQRLQHCVFCLEEREQCNVFPYVSHYASEHSEIRQTTERNNKTWNYTLRKFGNYSQSSSFRVNLKWESGWLGRLGPINPPDNNWSVPVL